MKGLVLFLCLFIVVLGTSGCATIVTGKYQNISVTSEPPGINVRADTGESIITPGSFNLIRNKNHTLVAEYEGAEPQQVQLKKGVQGWFWANILLGGVIGGVVDMASGACDKLTPDKVHFNFTTEGQIAAHRRHSYIRANPNLDEDIVLAIEHGAALKGMTKADLMASLGKPDKVVIVDDKIEELLYYKPLPQKYHFKNEKLEKVEDTG